MDITVCRKELLGKKASPEAEDWLVANVCREEGVYSPVTALCRNFLLGDFSRPFLESLSQHLYGEGYGELMGPYYEFISPAGGDKNIPYYKVYCFSRKRDSKLRSYLAVISARYFTKRRAKELARERLQTSIDASDKEKSNFWECDLKENEWFGLLLSEDSAEQPSFADRALLARLENAMAQLPERERKVLQLTVMDKVSGLEAFDELSQYMKSKRPQEEMDDKARQKAVAVLKFQAIAHLRKLMQK